MNCPQCGSNNRDTAKFCDECGFDLRSTAGVDVELAVDAPESSGGDVDASAGIKESPEVAPVESSDFDCEHPRDIVNGALGEIRSLRASVPSVIDVPPVMQEPSPDSAAVAQEAIEDARVEGEPDKPEAAAIDQSGADRPDVSVAPSSVADEARALFGSGAQAYAPKPLSAEVTADLSGLERLVDSSYVPPVYSGKAGDTMELPRVTCDAAPTSVSYRAEADKKEIKRQRKARRKLEREEKKRQKELQAQGARPVAEAAEGDGSSTEKAASDASEKHEETQKKPFSARKRAAVIAGVVVVVVAACAAAGYMMELWGGKSVPNVEGKSQADAIYILEDKGFTCAIAQQKSDEVEGAVLSTDPGAGSRAPEGSSITVNVATPRIIPDVIGQNEQKARTYFEAEGFQNVDYVAVKSNEPEGSVLSVDPAPGERGRADTAIKVEIAQAFTVPSVEGLSTEEATKLLKNEGYEVKTAWYNTEDIPEGTAVSTDPAAGEKLNSSSTVTLYVAHNRSTELESLTRAFFTDAGVISMYGLTYEISEVTSVAYVGDSTCSFSIVARPFETHTWMFGLGSETRYGNYETISGSITWDDDNNIVATDPVMKQGA